MRAIGTLPIAFAVALLIAAPAVAHLRAYVRQDAGSPICIDDRLTVLGMGGAVGGVLNTLGGTLDPLMADKDGTCYRPNHVLPNLNGDATFAIFDGTQSNVGGCVSQDSDGDGTFCNDSGDLQLRFCNQGTVNINLDPRTGLPLTNAWVFQDAQGAAARTTWVVPNPVTRGQALVAPVYGTVVSALHSLFGAPAVGPLFDCGPDVDNFGTAGDINHT